MSICDLPRIHFSGTAFLNAPTGSRNHYPLVDLSTNTILYNNERDTGQAVERQIPASAYHAYLDEIGERIDHDGHFNPDGPFNLAKGWGFGVNGHFLIDARIHHTQLQNATAQESLSMNDPLIGSKIEFWGHHNEYLGTTFNRARVFDGDPTSYWTRQLLVGRVTFGRRQESYKTPNAFSGSVNCTAHARWQRRDFLHGLTTSPIQHLLGGAALYQFTIDKENDQLLWMAQYPQSPTLLALKDALSAPNVRGLTIQFTISQMQLPAKPDTPIPHKIHGTISPWHVDELANYPAGRLLIPPQNAKTKTEETSTKETSTKEASTKEPNTEEPTLGALTCQVFSEHVTLNAFSAFPRIWNNAERTVVETVDFGPLEICCRQNGLPIAQISRADYCLAALEKSSGIIDLPLLHSGTTIMAMIASEGVLIRQAHADQTILLHEQEINLQTEDANIVLETDHAGAPIECNKQVKIVSFVRGARQPVSHIRLKQQHNPNALATSKQPEDRPVAALSDTEISTNEKGEAVVSLRGTQAGTARIHLSITPSSTNANYDNEDALRYWGNQGCLYVRTLPDDWHLLSIDAAAIDFDLIYKEIFYFHELTSSFMRNEVFSLQDSFKVETYRRLIWQMSDPDNRDKTYYMPPTRDLSYPKTILLYRYLQNHERAGFVPSTAQRDSTNIDPVSIGNDERATLVKALRDAADLEILVMQQYLYAAYSIPNYKTGQEYVEQRLWTPEQLFLLCGDGVEKQNFGLRGTLLEIAREEMIHFLVVNNLLMAIGEEFYAAAPEIYEVNAKFAMGITFGLEPFSLTQLEKFIELERPFVMEDLALAEQLPSAEEPQAPYRSISQLYQQIAAQIKRRPEFFVPRGDAIGGEHHLYLSEKLDAHHPDYQIQVYDVESALFAINFITEQGEGGTGDFVEPEESHYRRFKEMFYILASEETLRYQADPAARPWSPAYPCLRNPTLLAGTESSTLITEPTARELTSIFQNSYWLMLVIMNQHFGQMPNHTLRRSRLMNASIDVMTGILRPLGELIMTMPSGQLGHTAGISFQLPRPVVFIPEPERAYQTIAEQFALEERRARAIKEMPEAVVGMFGFYQAFFQDFADDPAKALS